MSGESLVPRDFEVPELLEFSGYRLVPLTHEHNERDYRAWTSSIAHIAATAGFPVDGWPHPDLTLAWNLAAIGKHVEDFRCRMGFVYTVLQDSDDEVVGGVCINLTLREGYDAEVRSWVRADRSALDDELRDVVRSWLVELWPFHRFDYGTPAAAG